MDTPPALRPSLIDVVDWIEAHLDEPLTLDAIAARSRLSPYILRGCSPRGWAAA